MNFRLRLNHRKLFDDEGIFISEEVGKGDLTWEVLMTSFLNCSFVHQSVFILDGVAEIHTVRLTERCRTVWASDLWDWMFKKSAERREMSAMISPSGTLFTIGNWRQEFLLWALKPCWDVHFGYKVKHLHILIFPQNRRKCVF